MAITHGPSRAARLLKTLVLAGVSLGASSCGGESRRSVEGSGGKSGQGAGGQGAGGGNAGGGVGGGGSAAGGVTGNVDSCLYPAQRVCACTYEPPAIQDCTLRHPYEHYRPAAYRLASMDCECEGSRPRGPLDCVHTQQFTCLQYDPEQEACFCDDTAPVVPEDCRQPGLFQCVADDPQIGCYCVVRIG